MRTLNTEEDLAEDEFKIVASKIDKATASQQSSHRDKEDFENKIVKILAQFGYSIDDLPKLREIDPEVFYLLMRSKTEKLNLEVLTSNR